MGHGFDICPQCGCNLWEEHSKLEREKSKAKYPNDCFCDIKVHDTSKDKFLEKRNISVWTGPPTNTHENREKDIYKCRKCGKEYIYPTVLYG